jgi:uncharacterized protein YndB with AHSA1/START domain
MSANTNRIEKKVLLRAPRARVWRALTDAREFGSWFGVEFDGDFEPGERLKGTISPTKVDASVAKTQKEYEGAAFEITVERVEPQRLFSFKWHPFAVERGVDYSAEPMTLVEFVLEEMTGGTLLVISETGFDHIPLRRRARAFEMNEQGWAMQAGLVEKYLAQAS